LKKYRITSIVGDKIVVCVSPSSVEQIYGKVVSIGKKRIGKVFDIIGRVDNPYIVIKLFSNMKSDSSRLIGKEIII